MPALQWSLLSFLLSQAVFGQSVLTPAPPLIVTTVGGFDPNCKDAIKNCELFASADECGGQYEPWARDNCALTCKYCVGPPTTPPPCVDVLDNCDSYDSSTCTSSMYAGWAKDNCRRTCRLCPADVLAELDSHTTTLSPDKCVDIVNCPLYTVAVCNGSYTSWAKKNCPNFCGFCIGLPTPPVQCVDKLNCSIYQADTCTAQEYRPWAEENCRSFCHFCSGGTQIVPNPPLLTPPPLTPPPLTPGKK